MKTSKLFFLKRLTIYFLSLFVVVGIFCGVKLNKKSNVFAAETVYDNETQILEDGRIISQNLWNALKLFYNNNKTDQMPSIKVNSDGIMYLTIEQFKDFPVKKLDLNGNNFQNNKITTIKNLSIFNLSAFEEIDLSNNAITSLNDELQGLSGLKKINISSNELTEFSFDMLANECYTQNLIELDISGNKIVNCNLQNIQNAQIDASNNRITKEALTLPTNADLKLFLTDNFISMPNTENLNISYGLQGVKNHESFVEGTAIEYYGIDGINEVKVYLLGVNENDSDIITETEVKTLSIGEQYTFPLGNYRIKFGDAKDNIDCYIAPKSPTIKMFQNNQEIELNHVITKPVVLKFFGSENAEFVVRINSGETKKVSEIEINTPGINNVVVYQIVDGYLSFATTLYIEYTPPQNNSWIFVFGGAVIFVIAFYFAIKFLPQLTKLNIGKKGNKSDLD